MPLELAQLVWGWPLALPLVAVVGARGLRAGRRRSALNEALHELRRPLQVLALASSGVGDGAGGTESALRMAAAALEHLEREINGEAAARTRSPVAAESLLDGAVSRWRRPAQLRGASLAVRCDGDDLTVSGDRGEIAQALDNLIVNALDHGGPRVTVAATPAPGALRLSVADSGSTAPRSRRDAGAGPLARLTGRRRHGHGLRVVRRVAAAHGGSFRLRHSAAGTEAELELPLLGGERR